MIVRTYGRRNREIVGDRTYSETTTLDDEFIEDDDDHPFTSRNSFTLSQEEDSPQEIYNFTYSSQDSARWTCDSDPYFTNSSSQKSFQLLAPIDESGRKSKKLKNGKKGSNKRASLPVGESKVGVATASLMETQEFGEMMEHVDEVNFALDGLKKSQQVRIRRASLLSLLSICSKAQERRLLRAHGVVKTIMDAILGLSLDDPSSNLAAAALFYVLTSDGQDDQLLESFSSIRFLLKLLKPPASNVSVGKVPLISHKLLAFRKDSHVSQDICKKSDSSSAAIRSKVKDILMNCNEMRASKGHDEEISRPELNAKWIALLIMEKACLSTVSIEETTGRVRQSRGNFKERLRELRGLEDVFKLAENYFSSLEDWLRNASATSRESKDEENLQCLTQLLKCLKIMENATFLSKENQSHLLGLKGYLAGQGFTEFMMNFVKVLSGLSLRRSSSTAPSPKIPVTLSSGSSASPYGSAVEEPKVKGVDAFSTRSSKECSGSGRMSSEIGVNLSQTIQRICSSLATSLPSNSEMKSSSTADNCMIRATSSSSFTASCSTSKISDGTASISEFGSKMRSTLGKRPYDFEEANCGSPEESQDPFAFDEDEFQLSKWDVLSGRERPTTTQKNSLTNLNFEDGYLSQSILSQDEFTNEESHHSSQTSSTAADEETFNLLADCLLSTIKVLMNLTNDNAAGCQQIAACEGLETLSSLIASHFPSFNSPSLFIERLDIEHGSQTDVHLTDHELDFLVAILGLLVNVVEKDGHNRSRLAAASVSLPRAGGLDGTHRGVIPLLCSIFLANQGAGEAAEEGQPQPLDAEEAVLQGEKEAEKMIVEAYAALLLAFLSTESKSIRDAIADCLPKHNVAVLVPVLERFVAFHVSLDMISPETHKAVSEVIESLRVL